MFTNYWDKMSGDSLASPWNQDGWAAIPRAPRMSQPGQGDGMMWAGGTPGFYGNTGNQMKQPHGWSTVWPDAGQQIPNQYQDRFNTISDMMTGGAPAQQPNTNNDTMKDDLQYGGYTTSAGHGMGYWSGGRPGAGSWIEATGELPNTPLQMKDGSVTTTNNNSGMVGGARSQMPGWTSAIGENDTSFMSYMG